jgi:hypothetical protein
MQWHASVQSVSFVDLGNRLRTGEDVPLREFRLGLQWGPPILHCIQLCKVTVLDHLGQAIPMPTIFCSEWKVHILFLSSAIGKFSSFLPARISNASLMGIARTVQEVAIYHAATIK